jgi:PEP-CTERM motif
MNMRFLDGFGRVGSIAAALTLTAVAVTPMMASPVTFGQYVQTNGAVQQWTISNSGTTTTITAGGSVQFLFSGVSGLPFSGFRDATFTLSATSGQIGNCAINCANTDPYTQQGYVGTFSIIDTLLSTNLLSGTFAVSATPATSGAKIGSTIGSSGAQFVGSETALNPLQLVLTSAYINFTGQTLEDASWSLSSLVPSFAVGSIVASQAYPSGSFNASGTGTFSAQAAPAPEPATFGLMGGALLGLGLLRRKKATQR